MFLCFYIHSFSSSPHILLLLPLVRVKRTVVMRLFSLSLSLSCCWLKLLLSLSLVRQVMRMMVVRLHVHITHPNRFAYLFYEHYLHFQYLMRSGGFMKRALINVLVVVQRHKELMAHLSIHFGKNGEDL